MDTCPSCSQACVRGWRRFFSRNERFKCPRCGTWLVYRQEKRPPSQRIANPLLRWTVFALGVHVYLVSLQVAVVYLVCLLELIPTRVTIVGMSVAFVAGMILSERSILSRLRLVVAERQVPNPQWDVARDLRALVATGDGRKWLGQMVLIVVLLYGELAALHPVVFAIARVLPVPRACMRPHRPAPIALPPGAAKR